jgi:DNA-directed RNA polymerase subunit M/transcription elongation factor TFIIS
MKKKNKSKSSLEATVLTYNIKKRKTMNLKDEDEESFFIKQFACMENVKQTVSALIEKSDLINGMELEIQRCPFCKHHTATYTMLQNRSADEGSTAMFRCTSKFCAKNWKGKC